MCWAVNLDLNYVYVENVFLVRTGTVHWLLLFFFYFDVGVLFLKLPPLPCDYFGIAPPTNLFFCCFNCNILHVFIIIMYFHAPCYLLFFFLMRIFINLYQPLCFCACWSCACKRTIWFVCLSLALHRTRTPTRRSLVFTVSMQSSVYFSAVQLWVTDESPTTCSLTDDRQVCACRTEHCVWMPEPWYFYVLTSKRRLSILIWLCCSVISCFFAFETDSPRFCTVYLDRCACHRWVAVCVSRARSSVNTRAFRVLMNVLHLLRTVQSFVAGKLFFTCDAWYVVTGKNLSDQVIQSSFPFHILRLFNV